MKFPTKENIIRLHQAVIETSDGSDGLRDEGLLESAWSQRLQRFGGVHLYPALEAKAAALAFSLINNHTFVDGSKRIGYAALENFPMMNGREIQAHVDEEEAVVMQSAAGKLSPEEFEHWLSANLVPIQDETSSP